MSVILAKRIVCRIAKGADKDDVLAEMASLVLSERVDVQFDFNADLCVIEHRNLMKAIGTIAGISLD